MPTYLTELGHVDKSSKVFEVRAFIIEFSKVVMLVYVSLTQWLQSLHVISSYQSMMSTNDWQEPGLEFTSIHCPQHARDEFINAPTLFDEWNKGRDSAIVVGGTSEVRKDHLLE